MLITGVRGLGATLAAQDAAVLWPRPSWKFVAGGMPVRNLAHFMSHSRYPLVILGLFLAARRLVQHCSIPAAGKAARVSEPITTWMCQQDCQLIGDSSNIWKAERNAGWPG